jgi:hypothetical protein
MGLSSAGTLVRNFLAGPRPRCALKLGAGPHKLCDAGETLDEGRAVPARTSSSRQAIVANGFGHGSLACHKAWSQAALTM